MVNQISSPENVRIYDQQSLYNSAIHPHVIDRLQLQRGLCMRDVEEFGTGTNGNNRVFRIGVEGDIRDFLIKYTLRNPALLQEEIVNHKYFLATSLGGYLSAPVFVDFQPDDKMPNTHIFAVPYAYGQELRKGIMNGEFDFNTGREILGDAINALTYYIHNQEQIKNPDISRAMIIQEWPNTLERAPGMLQAVAEYRKVSAISLVKSPLIIDGEVFPSMGSVFAFAHESVNTPPPYAMKLPPDLAWTNMVHDKKTKTTKWIDWGFGSKIHPAWLLVRLNTGESCSTAAKCVVNEVKETSGAVEINGIDVAFPPVVSDLQFYVQSRFGEFVGALDDPNLYKEYSKALIWDALRRSVLAVDPQKDGISETGINKAIWQMIRAAKLTSQYGEDYGFDNVLPQNYRRGKH